MRGFIVSRADSRSIPETIEVDIATAESCEVGALGTIVADAFVEATSPVATSAAVTHVTESAHGTPAVAETYPGFGLIAGERGFPPGRMICTELQPNRTKCRAPFTGSLPATTGGLFRATKHANGYWQIDFSTAGPFRYLRTVRDLPGESGPGATPTEVEVELVAGVV